MTVSTTGNRKRYTANGSTDTFSFPYHLQEKDDLLVYLNGTLKTLASDYNISGTAPFPSGVNVVFTSNPAADTVVLLLRSTDKTQAIDFNNLGDFDQDSIETALDRNALIAQDAAGLTDEAILAPSSFSAGFRLPEPAQAELLAWENVSSPTQLVNTGTTLTSFNASVAAAATSASNASTSETNAANSASAASTSATNAASSASAASTSATNAATSATNAATSAASASAITAGSLDGFVSVSGTVNAVANGQYAAADGSTIVLPTPGANVTVQVRSDGGGISSGITIDGGTKAVITHTLSGGSTTETITETGMYTFTFDVANDKWVGYPGSARHYAIDPTQTTTAINDDYTLTEDDKFVYATITSQKTVTLYASSGAEQHYIRNNVTSTANLIIARAGSDTIDDGFSAATSVTLAPGQGTLIKDIGAGFVIP